MRTFRSGLALVHLAVVVVSLRVTPASSQIPPGSAECVLLPGLAGNGARAFGITQRGWYPLAACGDSKTVDAVWQAVAWVQPQPGMPWMAEVLPGVDATKSSRANEVIYDERDLLLKACGFAYDGLDRLVAMHWTRTDVPPGQWVGTPLPTLIPNGEGSAFGILASADIAGGDQPLQFDMAVGWSMNDVDPPPLASGRNRVGAARAFIPKPVFWKRDASQWSIAAMVEYALLVAGVALSVSPDPGGLIRVAGWMDNTSGVMLPQVWESADEAATWTRTELPLPPGAVRGQATAVDHAGFDPVVAGFVEDLAGTRQAVAWMYNAGVWGVHEIGVMAAYPASEAMGVAAFSALTTAHTTVGAAVDDMGDRVAVYWNDGGGPLVSSPVTSLCADVPPATKLHEATAVDRYERIVGWGTLEMPPAQASRLHTGDSAGQPDFTYALADTDTVAWILTPATATTVGDTPRINENSLVAFPNPFYPDVRVVFSTREQATAVIVVYDARGRRVRTLFEGPTGSRGSVVWDGLDDDGNAVVSGIYFLRMRTGEQSITRKIVMLR